MDYLAKHFQIPFKPIANKEAVITEKGVRFTVLTERLIRMEYDSAQCFEDRASQVFWYRNLPVPKFRVDKSENRIEIETEYLYLSYYINQNGFSADSLSIRLKEIGQIWHYGDDDSKNLLGTARTLDGINGEVKLEKGLISRDGWSLIDDSSTLVFNENCWLENRNSSDCSELKKDLYFFGYGYDYQSCLKDFTKIAGEVPLIPKWALGNWWSRFWEYSQAELTDLMREFERREIPLSVCIVDMDWHIIKNKYTGGWTGYTWNKELFPDPVKFIDWLHSKDLKTALNLHPADGVHPHEEQYEELAKFMGKDPKSEKQVEFDITDPRFIKGYFEILHHPHENNGVDFWWMDWQQGSKTKMPGLDPLWALNHLHFYDLCRNGDKRPFIFSRWGGLGHHRYPIGFSGDTTVSWESLQFQPYFTATAANVGYGWWSHDIGGHRWGAEDPELYTRWVQFGVFSPILRLHSTKNPYLDRRPWAHGEDAYQAAKKAMRLRHALIAYIYSMAWRNHQESIPLITPMYHHYPEREEAYICPSQYYFGSELIVAPYTSAKDIDTNLSRQVVWLPEGKWFNFFTGEYFSGDKWHTCYGSLDEIPVFAKEGAIIPIAPVTGWNSNDNPEKLELIIFPGADNSFELYEDSGESLAYRLREYAITSFGQNWDENKLEFTIDPVAGLYSLIPKNRDYKLCFRGIKEPDQIVVLIDGHIHSSNHRYTKENETFVVNLKGIVPKNEVKVILSTATSNLLSKRDRRNEKVRKILTGFNMQTFAKPILEEKIKLNLDRDSLEYLKAFKPVLNDNQFRVLLEILYGVGINHVRIMGDEKIIMWNNQNRPGIDYQIFIHNDFGNDFDNHQLNNTIILDLQPWKDMQWRLNFDFFNLCSIILDKSKEERL